MFKTKSRYLRLLPGVVLVCGGLLVLKTSGLVHEAMALESAAAAAPDAMAAAPKAINADFSGGDSQISSAAEVDVLTSLSKRRATLDTRETEIQNQAAILTATQGPLRRLP